MDHNPLAIDHIQPSSSTSGISNFPRVRRVVMLLSCANLLGLLVICLLLHLVSEKWWLSTVVIYLPRSPYLILTGSLSAFAVALHRKAVWVNLLALGLVLIPIMDFRIPLQTRRDFVSSRPHIKILSCNLQNYEPEFSIVLQEISRVNPDIVAFQETAHESSLLKEYFREWHSLHVDHFWIGSRFPIQLIGQCDCREFDRTTAVKVEIQDPNGSFILANVHLMTARKSLEELTLGELSLDQGTEEFNRHVALRDEESLMTCAFLSEGAHALPTIIVGDFNMPTCSNLYRTHWGKLQNAFDVAGFGLGYTSPCKPLRFWFDGVPWIRIDHILASKHWRILHCLVGTENGSDHRLIAAEVVAK